MRWRLRQKASQAVVESRLVVDPVACDGVGMCAHLAPSLITLDRWGFPLISDSALTGRDRSAASRAVSGCPRRALFVAVTSGSAEETQRKPVDNRSIPLMGAIDE